MRRPRELKKAIMILKAKVRDKKINPYEASLCIGALEWALNEENVHTKWFEYRAKEIEDEHK